MIEPDVIIIGAGAYGLMTAVIAGRRGKRILILERNEQAGKKILISGGGRCNYTNLYTQPGNFISQNPRFLHNVLSRWTVEDTLQFFSAYGIQPKEKTLGQLFPVSGKAKDFRDGMLQEALQLGVEIRYGVRLESVEFNDSGFVLHSREGEVWKSPKVVIATGGKSIPAMGATDFGLQLAKQWGIPLIPDAPALVPLLADDRDLDYCESLAGLALETESSRDKLSFREALLFTHKGWSGPSVLQISSYWNPGDPIQIDFLPGVDFSELKDAKQVPAKILHKLLPARFLQKLMEEMPFIEKRGSEISKKQYEQFEQALKFKKFYPSESVGYSKAEVMRGGLDTRALKPQTLESVKVPGSYWGGEVVDVTGWLGGYNFQWAWACGALTGNAI